MRKVITIILCSACILLCACTTFSVSTQEENISPLDNSPAVTPEIPENTMAPRSTILTGEDMNTQYNLYRECKPAEDVFAIEEIGLPQTVADSPILPVMLLDENSALIYMYKAGTNGALQEENLETIGCYNIETGECEKWISANNELDYTIQAINGRYLVYRESPIPYTDNFLKAENHQIARLCVYDRDSQETYTVYEYPEEYIGSSIFYQKGVALVENKLYFDTVCGSGSESETMVYCADLSTLDVMPYMEHAQCPMFDGKEIWCIAKQENAYVLMSKESSEKIVLPDDVSEMAVGDSIFFKLNLGALANDEFATWELIGAQSDEPVMTTRQMIDDLRLEEGCLVWTSYADALVFLFDTQSDSFLCFDSLPEGAHYIRFFQGYGFLQLRTNGETHYYRLSKK